MYIEFPEVFDTVPTDFVCVESNQSNVFTFTVKELTRSYAIVTIKSTAGFNSINNFNWKAVAYASDSNLDIMKNWTFIGSVTGKQSSITLPSVFTELLVECAYDIGRYVNIVPKILISDDSRFFNLAGGFDLTNYGSDFGVFITNNKVTLRHGFVDSKDVSSSTITSVYCR